MMPWKLLLLAHCAGPLIRGWQRAARCVTFQRIGLGPGEVLPLLLLRTPEQPLLEMGGTQLVLKASVLEGVHRWDGLLVCQA